MSFLESASEFILGTNAKYKRKLPRHVKHAIKKQQMASEKLISWVLLFVMIGLTFYYYLLPKEFPEHVKFITARWILMIYLVFSVIRLICAYRNYLPTWFLMFSGVFDVALLIVLIWSLHLLYQQPPAFYLKTPALMFIFIFIALRTLHFEAKYVLVVGITAALGWLILLGYGVLSAPQDAFTNNFLRYMDSNDIFLSIEYGKVFSILVVTAILALAVARARTLLIQSIEEAIAARELSKFFAPELALNIVHLPEQDIKPGYGKLRKVAILHCDIRDSTEIAKRSTPTELIQLITEYQSRMMLAIRNNNGCIDKFLGDGILVSFNAMKPNQNYAADALRAAMEIVQMNDAWALERKKAGLEPIRIGVTVTAGQAIFGIVGDATRLEYTVMGDPVNVAVKLDKHSKVENCQILTTEEAFTVAVSQGFNPPSTVRKCSKSQVAGINEPVDLVVLQ